MKNIITILLLFLTLQLSGQILPGVVASQTSVAASAYTAEYQAVLDAMTTDPTGDTLTWQNDMVYSLDSAGFWDRMDLLYIFANRNAQGANIMWIDPGNHTITDPESTAPAFTVYEGYKGDGSTDYLSTNWARADTVHTGKHKISIFVYSRDNTTDSYAGGMGNAGINSHIFYELRYGAGTSQSQVNDGTTVAGTVATSQGFFVTTRREYNDRENYYRGNSVATGNASSKAMPSGNMYILAENVDGNESTPSALEISIFGVMDGVSGTDVTNLHKIFRRYMVRIGKGVE